MRRLEALAAASAAALMVAGGATWYFGPLGLLTCGAALAVLLTFINIRED